MNSGVPIILCLAYILGLLSTAAAPWGSYGLLGCGIVLSILVPWGQRQALRHNVRKGKKEKPLSKVSQKSVKKQQPLTPESPPKSQGKAVKKSANSVEKAAPQNSPHISASKEIKEIEETTLSPPLHSNFLLKLPRAKWVWLAAGIIGFLASFYFQLKVPQPAADDISYWLQSNNLTEEMLITMQGQVISPPRQTRSRRAQIWLNASQVSEIIGNEGAAKINQAVSGKVYATVPLLQATGVYPGQVVTITGNLYPPQPASNPGAFDFKEYLAKQGSFAGLKGRQLDFNTPETQDIFGLWKLRRRVLRSQVERLGVPEGPLVSAVVLGRDAVDLPYDIRDQFIRTGLAHVLAASGFQVSLILGVVLFLTQRFSKGTQLGFGVNTLLIYVGLTGASTSVLRAFVMGLAALLGLVLQRGVKPIGSLLIAATLLLVTNPLWIWDIGFEMSCLATLGLLVTVSPLMKLLNWLPPTLATLIAVPLAASIWVLPIQLYYFNVIAPYCLFVNIITVPLIWVISLGGMISAAAAIVWPAVGSILAWPLYYPAHSLIEVVKFFNQLPGNSLAVGAFSAIQVIVLYGLIGLVWWFNREEPLAREAATQKTGKNQMVDSPKIPLLARWWLATLLAIGIISIPALYIQKTLFQATVLDTQGEPILVIQDQGKVTLVNSGNENTTRFTVIPFLQKQGINQIDWSVSTHPHLSRGWLQVLENLPIRTFYDNPEPQTISNANTQEILNAAQTRQAAYQPLQPQQPLQLGSTQIQLIDAETPVVQFQIGGKTWLLLGDLKLEEQPALIGITHDIEVLWWSGKKLIPEVLQVLKPEVAIAISEQLDSDAAKWLQEQKTQLFWTGRDGAIQWTPTNGFTTTLEAEKMDGVL